MLGAVLRVGQRLVAEVLSRAHLLQLNPAAKQTLIDYEESFCEAIDVVIYNVDQCVRTWVRWQKTMQRRPQLDCHVPFQCHATARSDAAGQLQLR